MVGSHAWCLKSVFGYFISLDTLCRLYWILIHRMHHWTHWAYRLIGHTEYISNHLLTDKNIIPMLYCSILCAIVVHRSVQRNTSVKTTAHHKGIIIYMMLYIIAADNSSQKSHSKDKKKKKHWISRKKDWNLSKYLERLNKLLAFNQDILFIFEQVIMFLYETHHKQSAFVSVNAFDSLRKFIFDCTKINNERLCMYWCKRCVKFYSDKSKF